VTLELLEYLPSFLSVAILLLLRKLKNQFFLNAFIVSLVAIIADILIRAPVFSFFVSAVGVFYCFFWGTQQNKISIGVLLTSAPICIFFGLAIQEGVLFQARDLGRLLSESKTAFEAREKFNETCANNSNFSYCNRYVFFIGNESVGSSYLVALKFFGRQQIIPLSASNLEYESDFGD
jgi:hypothetical protein